MKADKTKPTLMGLSARLTFSCSSRILPADGNSLPPFFKDSLTAWRIYKVHSNYQSAEDLPEIQGHVQAPGGTQGKDEKRKTSFSLQGVQFRSRRCWKGGGEQ